MATVTTLFIPTLPDGSPVTQLADLSYVGARDRAVEQATAQGIARSWSQLRRRGYRIHEWQRWPGPTLANSDPAMASGALTCAPVGATLDPSMVIATPGPDANGATAGVPTAMRDRMIEALLDAQLVIEDNVNPAVFRRLEFRPGSAVLTALDPAWSTRTDDQQDSIAVWDAGHGRLRYLLQSLQDGHGDIIRTVPELDEYIIHKHHGRAILYLAMPGVEYKIDFNRLSDTYTP